MKTTGGFKLWQIIYPIGIYYVVSSLMYFVLGLFLGDGQQTYMLRQLICSAATIPLCIDLLLRQVPMLISGLGTVCFRILKLLHGAQVIRAT